MRSMLPLLVVTLLIVSACGRASNREPAPAAAGAPAVTPEPAPPAMAPAPPPVAPAPAASEPATPAAAAPPPRQAPAPTRARAGAVTARPPAPAAATQLTATPVAPTPTVPRPDQQPALQAAAPVASPPAAVAEPEPVAPQLREFTLPQGTMLPLVIASEISSATARVESPVRATLRQAITIDGRVVLQPGTLVLGTVAEVARPGRVSGRARLVIAFDRAEVDGERVALRTQPLRFEADPGTSGDAAKVGGGAIGGAIIGGILGGAKGAAKGAAVGGAAGAGAVLTMRGQEVVLAAGTDVAAMLAAPLTLTVPD